MDEGKLRPCPWCGRADKLEIYRPMQPAGSNRLRVQCGGCGCLGPCCLGSGTPAAIDAWNRRPDPDDAGDRYDPRDVAMLGGDPSL